MAEHIIRDAQHIDIDGRAHNIKRHVHAQHIDITASTQHYERYMIDIKVEHTAL
jgi:hypothetical protein